MQAVGSGGDDTKTTTITGLRRKPRKGGATMKFSEMQSDLRHFAAERDWQQFHTPKNLSTALMVEAAELAEIFQWMTPDQSLAAALDPDRKQRINDEVADVLLYLLQLADHCQIDIASAAMEKLARNAVKYPALRTIARVSPSHAAAPGAHVLLDYENVQPTEEELRALAPEASQVWVFHGPHQRQIDQRFAGYGAHVTAVPISRTGRNALDFHLSFYMGYIASRNPSASLIVVANDRGYEPMLEHARAMGFSVRQLGHGKATPGTPAAPAPIAKAAKSAPTAKKLLAKKPAAKIASPAKKAAAKAPGRKATPVAKKKAKPATPTPAKKTAPTKKTPVKATAKKSSVGQSSPAAKTSAPAPGATTRHLTDSLLRMRGNRPTKPQSLRRALKSFLGPDASDQAVEAELARLIGDGVVKVDSEKGVSYPGFAV
jgi:NTP pyrophosphatase (non-canonical NTP hydrolase)